MTPPNDSALLDGLVDAAGETLSFRTTSSKVGSVYTMDYRRVTVSVYDYDREQAGGLPHGGFLIAAQEAEDNTFILLRILKEARLPNANAGDQTRQQAVESTANEGPWPDALDPWMQKQLSLHAIECRLLGTFIDEGGGQYRYAEDTDNFFSVNKLMVWKPCALTLSLIVNHRHRRNAQTGKRTKIGRTRFSAAERNTAIHTNVLLDPYDLLQRRTVYLGMSRSGKSNAMKITAQAIYRLREQDSDTRIGQLIFDPNGEYAHDNPQDGAGLHRIHETIGLDRENEVETYGLFATPTDPHRKIMKINFFGSQFPNNWNEDEVAEALDQLLAGRIIIQDIMTNQEAHYMRAFRDVDLSIPEDISTSRSSQVRYRRAILAYQAALADAGLDTPSWQPSIRGLFNKEIIEAMEEGADTNGDNYLNYNEAAELLARAKSSGSACSWPELITIFKALNTFIGDRKSNYGSFEKNYIRGSKTGERWADARLQNLLSIFNTRTGPRSFQRAGEQHDPNSVEDFSRNVISDLQQGKLVIIDQSTGDPKQNEKAAERIMWRVFRTQQDAFRSAVGQGQVNRTQILVYLEEAHNLLPKASNADTLRGVWARSAKEGSKMNIGMVLATQAPSSIMPEILSETDNWILAYLNSSEERRVIARYMDFEDFLDQIGHVSEPGFVRMRTLSLAYTVPVQFDRFFLDLPVMGDG